MNQVIIRVLHDRKKTATKTHAALVQLEVRANAERKFITTGIKVCKGQFKAGRVVGRSDAESLNERITQQIAEINEFVRQLDERHQLFTVAMLDHINDAYTSASFLDFMERRISERPIAEGTKRNHRKVLNFLRGEYRRINTFADLTLPAIVMLDEYLHHRTLPDGRKMLQPSIHTYHKVIKAYVNDAIMLGLANENPYSRFRSSVGQSRQRTILTMDEVNLIRHHITRSTLMAKVRDLFITQCYTGLAYADLMAIDFTNAELHGDTWLIPYNVRQKTGTAFMLALLPPVMEVLQRYNFHLPHLAYDVYNRNLKALALSVGITKTVTTHIGRHTFATTIALGSGVPIEVVSKMLGHTDIKTTQIYAKIMPDKILGAYDAIKKAIS